MEVTLLDSENLPEGCLLSIRTGSTRRQAALDSKFKLFFPKGGKPGEDVKVDALLPVGTHVMRLQEGQEKYELDLGGMKVSLHMKEIEQHPLEEAAADPKETDPAASHRHRVAVSAKKYLDEHELLGWAHRLFQDLIHDQPDDPWAYIERRTDEARAADLVHKAELKKMDEAKLAGLQSAPELPEEANLEEDDGVLRTEVEALDNIRMKAHDALMKAAEDGSLERALNAQPPEKTLDQIRALAANTLLMAAQNGTLEAALSNQELDQARKKASALLLQAAEDGTLQQALQGGTKDVDALRREAAATLLKAAQDGSLEAVLKKPEDMDALRKEAANTLLKAAQDGTLQAVLSQQPREDVEALRVEASKILLKAAGDGTLEAVLRSSKQKEEELEAVRAEASRALIAAAENGTLERVLQEKTEEDRERLRCEAATVLLKAAENGTLEEVLQMKGSNIEAIRQEAARALAKAVEEPGALEAAMAKARGERDVQVLKQEAAMALLRAAEDGSLNKAFAETRGEDLSQLRKAAAETLLSAAADGRLEQALQSPPAEDLRLQARDVLSKAAKDGRLDSALKHLHPEEDLELLRQTAASSLLEAAKDGRLEQALGTVKEEDDVEAVRLKAAASMLRAAEDGRLATALQPRDLEQMRQEAAEALLRSAQDGTLEQALLKETGADREVRDLARMTFEEAALDGRLADALSQTISRRNEPDVEALRLAAKDTLLAACADGRLESALKSRGEVVSGLTEWAAENCSVADPQEIQAIKEKAADALVRALGMEADEGPEQVEEAPLDIANVKAKASDALQKALGIDEQMDLEEVKAKAAGALQKVMTPEAPQAPQGEGSVAATDLVVSEVKEIARQVREELGKFHGEVTTQLQDLRLISNEMRRDVEDLKTQVGEKKSSTTFGQSSVTTIKPEDPLSEVAGGSLVQLERKIRERNERMRRENAAMREENNKLKMMGPKAD